MSDSYLDGKVREALLTAKGSRSMAQNLLMVWAMKDERLLRFLAQPFLKAISGAAVAGAIKRGVTVPGLGGPPPKVAPKLSERDLMSVLGQLGRDEDGPAPAAEARPAGGLSAADILGGAGKAAPARGPAAPADQAATMRTLAAVYARKNKRSQ